MKQKRAALLWKVHRGELPDSADDLPSREEAEAFATQEAVDLDADTQPLADEDDGGLEDDGDDFEGMD